jgi:NhaA family Na+:H+ antiporter
LAFAAGCLSLVRKRVTSSVFVFLTALAIFDDLGSIVVIAVFYGGAIHFGMLALSVVLALLLFGVGALRVQVIWPYVVLGLLLWVATLASGIHATVAGVVIGLALPAAPARSADDALDDLDAAITSLRRDCAAAGVAPDGAIAAVVRHARSVQSPLERAMHSLHGVVAYGIVPLFALANAGMALHGASLLESSVTWGALLGLVIGKPLGILGTTWLVTRSGLGQRPAGATWPQLVGVSLMGGVGFTMSLLVSNLGLGHSRVLEDQARLGVLVASLISAALGLAVLRRYSPISEGELAQAGQT